MTRRRSDTREQIRQVALELFAEQGYEKTSLREIAERLGVTKAALYYHFKTKEDIVNSLSDDVRVEVQGLLAWASARPRTLETRREVIRRYHDIMRGQGAKLMRFMMENGPAVRDLKAGDDVRERFKALAAILVDKDAPLPDQIRARLAIVATHMSVTLLEAADATPEELQAAAQEVALDLLPSP